MVKKKKNVLGISIFQQNNLPFECVLVMRPRESYYSLIPSKELRIPYYSLPSQELIICLGFDFREHLCVHFYGMIVTNFSNVFVCNLLIAKLHFYFSCALFGVPFSDNFGIFSRVDEQHQHLLRATPGNLRKFTYGKFSLHPW